MDKVDTVPKDMIALQQDEKVAALEESTPLNTIQETSDIKQWPTEGRNYLSISLLIAQSVMAKCHSSGATGRVAIDLA